MVKLVVPFRAMKSCRGLEIESLVTSALDGGEQSRHAMATLS